MAVAESSRSNGRRRSLEDEEDEYSLPADYTPYVPVAKRRAQLLSHLGAKQPPKKIQTSEEVEQEREEATKELEEDEERLREKLRKERTLLQAAQEVKEQRALDGGSQSAR